MASFFIYVIVLFLRARKLKKQRQHSVGMVGGWNERESVEQNEIDSVTQFAQFTYSNCTQRADTHRDISTQWNGQKSNKNAKTNEWTNEQTEEMSGNKTKLMEKVSVFNGYVLLRNFQW